MMWLDRIGKQSKTLILVEGFLLVAFLGIADYKTGEELFFLEFYLLPVILLTWFVSEQAGIAASMMSGVFWFLDDVLGRPAQGKLSISYSNVFLKMIVFVILTRILTALKKAIAREKIAEQEQVRREIEIAQSVQRGLFPQVLPPMRTLDYFGICEAANGVGGDYYDFVLLSRACLGIGVGDISGKGISSALLMSNLQAMLRSNALLYHEKTDQLIHDINNQLCQSTNGTKYATFFYGIYEDGSRQFRYVNAGHNPPCLLRDDRILHLDSSGTVIGLFPNRTYREDRIQLLPGDLLVLTTDGVVEARNSKEEEFGEEKLDEFIIQNQDKSAKQFVADLVKEVANFADEAPQHDDITVVAMRIT